MKASFLFKTISVLLLCATLGLQAFEDLPALTRKKRIAQVVMRSVGAIVGTVGGPVWVACEARRRRMYDENKLIIVGAGISTVGAIAGYKAMDFFATQIFAYQHEVGRAIQKISLFYNINIEQYRSILQAATKVKIDKNYAELCDALRVLYSQRFGADWQGKLEDFFTHYREYAIYLSGLKAVVLDKQERELLRMIEIGAALESLCFGTKASRKTMVQQAVKLYQLLGFYDPFAEKQSQEGV